MADTGRRGEGADRLSHDAEPTAEAVELTLDPERADYHGRVTVALDVRTPVSELRFHARALTIDDADVRGPGGVAQVAGIDRLDGDQARVRLAAPLASGHATLTMRFHNDYDTHAVALYRVVTGGRSYLFTQFEDTEAREAFPCWDEPSFKIPWTLTLDVPAADLAVSNTPIDREARQGATKRVAFATTRPLPSYLVAIAVGPFDSVPIHGLSVPGRVITVHGSAAMAAEAARVTPPILRALERYFGRPYPYAKLDLIGAPEFLYGAMENAGAVVFAERALLLDPRAESPDLRRRMEGTLTHELAHMWFGDLVTMKWWNDLWLNESFANWMEAKTMATVFPAERTAVVTLLSGERAMAIDSRPSTRPIRFRVSGATSLGQTANELTYDKGQAVLEMFEGWLGPEPFRTGVLRYLDAHAWGNAEGRDLFQALGGVTGEDIDGAMSSFLDQPGLPLITVEPLAGGRVRLSQRRFLTIDEPAADGADPSHSESKSDASARWEVPVILRYPATGGVRSCRVWLAATDTVVSLGVARTPEWIEPNAGGSGYYRWSVPASMLDALVQHRAQLTPRERIDLIACLTASLEAGSIHADRYLADLGLLADDPAPEVVQEAVRVLNDVRVPLATPRSAPAFAGYLRRTFAPALARFGMEPRAGEPVDVAENRPPLLWLLAVGGEDTRVLGYVEGLNRSFRRDRTSIPASMVETAIVLGAWRGDRTLFDDYEHRFATADVPADRLAYLAGLGTFRDPALRRAALEFALTAHLRPQEVTVIPGATALNVLEGGAARGGGRVYPDDVARWALDHFDELASRMPPNFSARLLGFEAGCSTDRLTALRAFLDAPAHHMIGGGETLRRLGDTTRECVGLHDRESERVEHWLAQRAPHAMVGTRQTP